MKLYFILPLLLLGILAIIGTSHAEKKKSPFYPTLSPHTPESVMQLAYEAVRYVTETGDMGEFNKKKGRFTQGEVLDYHFVSPADCLTGEVLAHPFLTGMTCKKGLMKKFKDARGKLYAPIICSKVKKNPKGRWTMAYQSYPNSTEASPMPIFVVGIPNTSYYVSVLARELNRSEEELNALVEAYQNKHYPQVWPDKIAEIQNPCEKTE